MNVGIQPRNARASGQNDVEVAVPAPFLIVVSATPTALKPQIGHNYRVASTNQHTTRMGTRQIIARGACGGGVKLRNAPKDGDQSAHNKGTQHAACVGVG